MALTRRSRGLRLKSVSAGGHDIPCLEGGNGEPLLLPHGFAANKDHWTMIARYLTPHFRLVAPDVPAFGDSTRDDAARYGPDEQIARIDAFADALGLERFHLGGNSMGGYLAAVYAARHPARVESLWLLAPAGVLTAEPSDMQHLFKNGENPLLIRNVATFDELSRQFRSGGLAVKAQEIGGRLRGTFEHRNMAHASHRHCRRPPGATPSNGVGACWNSRPATLPPRAASTTCTTATSRRPRRR